jgi:mono/diheme cytochrome c family protein
LNVSTHRYCRHGAGWGRHCGSVDLLLIEQDGPFVEPAQRRAWLVAQLPTGAQPTETYQVGYPPLFLLGGPSDKWTPATSQLARQVAAGSIIDPRNLDDTLREEMGKVFAEMFGSQGEPRVPDGEWLIEQLGLRDRVVVLRQACAANRAQAAALATATSGGKRQALGDWNAVDLEEERRAVEQSIADLGAYVKELRLDGATLKEGRAQFRKYCVNCHGQTGAGDGFAARWQPTLPRDYRQGIFKFIGTDLKVDGKRKPSRSDLHHTIFFGTDEGSPMPQFSAVFTDAQLQQVVSYVIHLSMVGETEYELLKNVLDPHGASFSAAELRPALIEQQAKIASLWVASGRTPIVIEPDPYVTDEQKLDAAARGHDLFRDPGIGCMACHPRYGRQALYWFDSWASIVRTRDLTQSEFCGGTKPEKLYARIYGGIPGSNMPSYSQLVPTPEERAKGIDRIWQLVHFTRFVSNSSDRESWQTLRDKKNIDLSAEAGPPGDSPEQKHARRPKAQPGGKR